MISHVLRMRLYQNYIFELGVRSSKLIIENLELEVRSNKSLLPLTPNS